MKKALTILMCLASMMAASTSLKAQEVTIPLMPGWTWISYPSMDTVDFATALGSFTPATGDIIESLYGIAEYINGAWYGDILHFYPGYGYMYYSNRPMPVSLTFNAQQPAPQVVVTTAEPTDITSNSATSGGSITTDAYVFAKGICWATHPNPTPMDDNHSENGSGGESFTAEMTELGQNTTYYVRAYAVTQNGIVYGNEVSFTTIPIWTIEATPNPTDGGTITGAGDYEQNAVCNLTATTNEGFVFTNWTENGEVVSTEATLSFTVTEDRTLVANFAIPCPTGAIDAKFSINNNGDMVYFSQGNLQYRASTNTWRFADNQYDYVGSTNSNISSTYSGWIDLFAWGTSGYNHGAVCYQPWSISENNSDYFAYGYSSYNLNEQNGQADWGYNAISNGGNQTNQWRTLTKAEWVFLLNTRNTPSGIRFAMAKVNNVNGVIILPDNWSNTYYALNNTNNTSASFSSNSISLSSWSTLETNGAVFLPAAGFRDGTYVYGVGSYGGYQTATYYNSNGVYDLYFSNSYLLLEGTCPRSNAQSVRLVRSIPTYTINTSVIPSEGGTVTGTGNYAEGQLCTLTAIASSGYTFVNWIENGEEVSTEASYSFTVMGSRSFVAHFIPTGSINGLFSVSASKQVYFSQGNLQYKASSHRWQFAEHQWDCLGTSTGQNSGNTNVDRDLFGWGTSGYNHGAVCYQPWSTSTNESHYYAYGHDYYDLYDQTGKADWGYNPIYNGGNQTNQWRTLMDTEWSYVFNTRTTVSGIRYAKANVNGINGVILLPNDWDASYYSLNNTNQGGASFSSNTVTMEQWRVLEQHGAVFLPAAGWRHGSSVNSVGICGDYWSSSYEDSDESCEIYFTNSSFNSSSSDARDCGFSVRLVRNVIVNYTIETSSNPLEGGTVTGAGSYPYGSTITLVANANEGYVFSNWTENGEVVSTNANYSFTVNANRTLVANFNIDVPTGAIGGLFTINYNGDQVYFSRGNLQYQASTNTWRFAENQYNYVGNSNSNASSTYSGWIDLFGWGTSGYNHGAVCYQPWSMSGTSSDYYAYGQYIYNLYDQSGMADWGYNPIGNGGNQSNQWRTLTEDEWYYIINYRQTSSGVRWVQARVNYVNGMILLPDDWSNSYYSFNFPNINSTDWGYNPISSDTWNMLEQHGAVFLPAAGTRWEDGEVNYVVSLYWSASSYNENTAGLLSFGNSTMGTGVRNRFLGGAVRLVQDVE